MCMCVYGGGMGSGSVGNHGKGDWQLPVHKGVTSGCGDGRDKTGLLTNGMSVCVRVHVLLVCVCVCV